MQVVYVSLVSVTLYTQSERDRNRICIHHYISHKQKYCSCLCWST